MSKIKTTKKFKVKNISHIHQAANLMTCTFTANKAVFGVLARDDAALDKFEAELDRVIRSVILEYFEEEKLCPTCKQTLPCPTPLTAVNVKGYKIRQKSSGRFFLKEARPYGTHWGVKGSVFKTREEALETFNSYCGRFHLAERLTDLYALDVVE